MQECRGPGPSIATHDYRHHNASFIGGGMIANDFGLTPIGTWSMLTPMAVSTLWGAASKRGMRDLAARIDPIDAAGRRAAAGQAGGDVWCAAKKVSARG